MLQGEDGLLCWEDGSLAKETNRAVCLAAKSGPVVDARKKAQVEVERRDASSESLLRKWASERKKE